MSWRNVNQTPKYFNGGPVMAQANPGAWSGLSKISTAIQNRVAQDVLNKEDEESMWEPDISGEDVMDLEEPPVYTAQYGMYIPKANKGAYMSSSARAWQQGQDHTRRQLNQDMHVAGGNTAWDTGDLPVIDPSSLIGMIQAGSKGYDDPNNPGIFDKLDIDNVLGGVLGAGKWGAKKLAQGYEKGIATPLR